MFVKKEEHVPPFSKDNIEGFQGKIKQRQGFWVVFVKKEEHVPPFSKVSIEGLQGKTKLSVSNNRVSLPVTTVIFIY